MKTSLKVLALFTAASVPSAFAMELTGVDLPASFAPLAAFSAFVVSWVTLVAFTDYARPRPRLVESAVTQRAPFAKAPHPLAA